LETNDDASTATILVVDDYPANLLAAVAVLEPLGYRIVTAASGHEALELAHAEDLVTILMDVHMPELDGYETTALLRRNERSRDVPIIFMTAVYNLPEHAHRGYALGAVDFITKPFDAEILRAKVRALVALYLRGQRSERARSREIGRIKDLFLGGVGHDLRNPLSTIAMAAKLLATRPCSEESHRSHAARIDRACRRMNDMIEDVLDLTRGQFTEGIPVTLEPVDVADVCRTVVSEFRVAHPDRALELDIDGDARVLGDSGRLARVVSNLIGNALQHCAEKSVQVRVLARDERVAIAVHNAGWPIPESALPNLFEPFRRGEGSSEGLGLGLYLVREIARAHGGTASVTSTASDGTIFTVTLPRGPQLS
jgi:two-component system sensor histidine kinase/response regulator